MAQLISQLGSAAGQGIGAVGSGVGQAVQGLGTGVGQGLGGLVNGVFGRHGPPAPPPPRAGAAPPSISLSHPLANGGGMNIRGPAPLPEVSSALPQLAGVDPRLPRELSIDPKRLSELGELLRQSTPPPTGAAGPRLSAGGAGDGTAQIAAGMRTADIMSRMPRDPRTGRRIPLGALSATLRQG